MAASASSITRNQPVRRRLTALSAAYSRFGAGLGGWVSRIGTTGQLGTDREREIGRRTGARV